MLFFFLFIAVVYLITFLENKNKIKSPKIKNYPKISILVPAYNEEKTIEKTINSLIKQNYPKDKFEIIVIDNNSTDKTLEIAKKYKNIIIISEKKPGKGCAMNAGLRAATGDIIGALDSDSFVLPNALKRMAAHFEDPEITSVTPSIKVWGANTWLEKVQHLEYLSGAIFRKLFALLGGIPITAGPLTLYRKEFLKKTGGWDEKTLGEDIELCLRVESKFGKNDNAIDVNVYTTPVNNLKDLYNQRLRWYRGFIDNIYKYRHLFSKKHGNFGLFILPVSVLVIIFGGSMTIYGIYQVLKNLIKFIQNLILYEFNLEKLFDFNFDPYFLNIDAITITTGLLLIIGITFLILAQKHSEEKQPWITALIYFMLTYSIMYTTLWTITIFYKITKRKIRWGGRYI